jgi:hypothetical protein
MQNHNGNGTAVLLARGLAALWATLIVAAPAGALAASTETVLHAFAGGSDGNTLFAGLITDGEGNLYGITEGGGASYAGTVFELKRPVSASGTWSKTVLYDFKGGSDSGYPFRGLIADSQGNFYGTAEGGPSDGHSVRANAACLSRWDLD